VSTTATAGWMAPARALLDRLEATQSKALDEAAGICAEAIAAGGLVHMFGSGHSRIAVEEMFPRYGSYPGFNPIVELSMTFHTQVVGANGQRQAMFIERIEGLGEEILKNFSMAAPDAMVVVSASGLGAVTIDVAIGARARGLPVIVLTSVEASDAGEPGHSSGRRLHEHAAGRRACRPRRPGHSGGPRFDRGLRGARERAEGAHRCAAARARRPSAGAHEPGARGCGDLTRAL
jgi:uncharacterized phosphosugar-binding protein